MLQTNPNRRALLGTIAFAPLMTVPVAAATFADSADRELLAAFRARQQALATMELRGSYFDADDHSPSSLAIFDEADQIIFTTPAHTRSGALAKLWVALCAAGGQVTTKQQADHHDVFRRADVEALVALDHEQFEFDEALIASVIIDLSRQMEG